MHVNKINGKRYIGITSKNPLKRWQNGKGYYKNEHFMKAIMKYGWMNFEHIIVETNLSRQDACEKERELIRLFNTQDKRFGYNLTDGGDYFKHSEESKKKMSENRKGKGKVKRTEEQKQNMREHHAGGAEKVKVMCVETGEVFDSINDASRATGINKKQISGCCRNVVHYNTAGGKRWRYAE